VRAATFSRSFVAPQGLENDAPLGAAKLQSSVLAGWVFLQASVYLHLDRLNLGTHGRLAHS
jgi:hypothetical protein